MKQKAKLAMSCYSFWPKRSLPLSVHSLMMKNFTISPPNRSILDECDYVGNLYEDSDNEEIKKLIENSLMTSSGRQGRVNLLQFACKNTFLKVVRKTLCS